MRDNLSAVFRTTFLLFIIGICNQCFSPIRDSAEYNETPIAFSQSVCTPVNTLINITLHAYDSEDHITDWIVAVGPDHGSISASSDLIVFTPELDYTGVDNFMFKVSDGKNESNVATVTIKIGSCDQEDSFTVPDGRTLHGLGQYIPDFWGYTDAENWQNVQDYESALGEGAIPLIYSVYLGICPESVEENNTDILDITGNHTYPYMLVIGLYLLDENQSKNVNAVLSGEWDDSIRSQAASIKSLDSFVFIRPGFEFGDANGVHGAYTASEFKAIWLYLRNIFSEENVNKAIWVWNAVNPDNFSFMEFYPGDGAVDWWGINYFTVEQMSGSTEFLVAAENHNKPVMICESCPIHDGGTTNESNWNDWFVPYFNLIGLYDIKAFIYINDPWDKQGFWDEWADSRININPTINNNYKSELADDRYIHMDEYEESPDLFNN